VPDAPTEIYQSAERADCDERSLVLAAAGIASSIGFDGARFLLGVEPADVPGAVAQLHAYAMERRAAHIAVAQPPARVHRGAWLGCVVYVVALFGIALAVSNGIWRVDAFERGELNAALVQSGQWWRAWTALTLHRDGAHLLANLGAGVWFGYLAARQLGAGMAWLLIVTGAAATNLFNAHFGPPDYRSVGASTAVFTALGLMAAHSWRSRYHLRQRWALRWAPLIAGVVLLGWFGSAGEGTDLIAHAVGFVGGCLLGASVATRSVAALLEPVPQWLSGLAALATLSIAWAYALSATLA
jgi:membrane associated rhomboid family serine protease